MGAHEKRGRRPPLAIACLEFVHWTNANLLTHLPTTGPLFTWHNGQLGLENVALRLDRSICNCWVFVLAALLLKQISPFCKLEPMF
jgi:hypothetical protein